MNYCESLEYVHSLMKFGINPGLSRVAALLDNVGNPQKALKCVHIAGTNGKGSTATALSRVMNEAGYKTGLYTSPYVAHFLERIQIDSSRIDEELFAKAITELQPFVEEMHEQGECITEFELITCAAFLCFVRADCDIVILETGLGGRLDATNIIDSPLLEIITSVSLDHTAILGDTLTKIAYEKCGIIKPGTNVITYPNQPFEVSEEIKRTVFERCCTLIEPISAELVASDVFGSEFLYDGESYFVSMPGEHQVKNMSCVIEAVRILRDSGFEISTDALKRGIKDARLPARTEVLLRKPLVILDGGHNPDGIEALCKLIEKELCGKSVNIVIGMMADKDVEACVSRISPLAHRIFCVTPENPRSIPSSKLCEMIKPYNPSVIDYQSLVCAVKDALAATDNDEALIICGSLYLAGDIYTLIKSGEICITNN